MVTVTSGRCLGESRNMTHMTKTMSETLAVHCDTGSDRAGSQMARNWREASATQRSFGSPPTT